MEPSDLLYLFYGEEGFLIEEAINDIKGRLIHGSFSDFNVEVFYAPENSPSEIINSAYTLPALSAKRLIIVRDAHKFSRDQLDKFVPYLREPSPTTCAVFIFKEVDINGSFFKEFKKTGKIVRFRQLYERDIPTWIKRVVARLKKRITDEACEYLLTMVGSNTADLSNEIEKVALYVGDKRLIELKDVKQSVAETPFHSIFDLVRYVGEGNVEKALRALHSLLETGTHPLVVLKMISRQFRYIWKAKEVMDQGGDSEAVRKDLKISGYSVRSYMDQAKGITYERIPHYFDAILTCDLAIKSGQAKEQILLEKLIFDLCLLRDPHGPLGYKEV